MGEVCCVLLSLITAEKVFFVVLKETNICHQDVKGLLSWRPSKHKGTLCLQCLFSWKQGRDSQRQNVFLPFLFSFLLLKTGCNFYYAFFYQLREDSRRICQQPYFFPHFPAIGSFELLFFCPDASQKCTALCWRGNPGWTLSHWFELLLDGAFSHVVRTGYVNKLAGFSLGKFVFCYKSLSPLQINEGQGNAIYFLFFMGKPIAFLTLDGCLMLEKVSLRNHC